MALLQETRVDQLLREKLRQRGVLGAVEDVVLFATPERLLADVVLRDASVLEEAQQAAREVERELEREGVSLAATTQALWQVEAVERVAIPNPPGAPPGTVGALFKGILKAGGRLQEVWVSMSPSAQQILRPLAANDQAWLSLVRTFLEHWLSIKGAGYWDPIREQSLEIDDSAARYLRWRPYEQLKRSVNSVFRSLDSARGFLKQFTMLGKKVGDINHVLEELPGPGGAIARGERLPTGNRELYEMLLTSEKDEWWQYYRHKLEQACRDWPELKRDFQKVFSN